ncbi:MAG: hypothetical protein GY784_04335 [Gammaproteobacteria bacterium]|nr:hypothetical protein [Gammaproteobacteria bacterium]
MKKILVTTKGVDGTLVRVIEFLFSNSQYYNFSLTNRGDESIAIFQLESATDVHQLKTYQKAYPARSALVVCKQDVGVENIVFLKFPVSPSRLMQALCRAARDLPSTSTETEAEADTNVIRKVTPRRKSVGLREAPQIDISPGDSKVILTLPDVDLDTAKSDQKIFYDEGNFLQGRLQNAVRVGREKGSNIQIHTPHGVFQYYPGRHRFLVELGTPSLRNLASMFDTITPDMTVLDSDNSHVDSDREKQICADELIWKTAIWASRGRLVGGVDLDREFSLTQWPNFTRWMSLPNDMQLTTAWLNRPTTLREFVESSDIPQRYIFTFFSAAYAVGLITFGIQGSVQAKPVRKSRSATGASFISRIIDYIKADTVSGA